MQKAGGIIALIAGVSGVWVAGILILLSALSGTWDEVVRSEIALATWSSLTTVFAAVAIGAKGKTPGVLLIITALSGPVILLIIAVLFGPVIGGVKIIFFAIFMLLALVGGLLAIIGAESPAAAPEEESG